MLSGRPCRTVQPHYEHSVWKWTCLQLDNIHTDRTTTSERARIVWVVTIVVASLDTAEQKDVGAVVHPPTKLDTGVAPRRLFRRVPVLSLTH